MKRFAALIVTFAALLSFTHIHAERTAGPDLSKAASALLMDADSGRIILEKNADEKVEAAGLKRLPALLMVCDAFDSGTIKGDAEVTVPEKAAGIKGPTAFLSVNERIKAELLLKASVMLTAGDSILSLLNAVFPSESAALESIRKRTGLELSDSMGNGELFTAMEIASVALELAESEAFRKYSSVYTDSLEHENAGTTELTNPNRLVRFYSGCFGLATGSVGASEYSGAFIARRGTTTFLAVLTGMQSSKERFELAAEMLDYGFSSYRTVNICDAGTALGTVEVIGGTENTVEAITGESVSALTPVGSSKVITEAVLPDEITAPVKEGETIGSMLIKGADGEAIKEVPLYAKNSVDKAKYAYYFKAILTCWLRGSQH